MTVESRRCAWSAISVALVTTFIEAPRAAIDGVIEKHALVRDLVGHGWLQLLRIDGDTSTIEQRRDGAWHDSLDDMR